MTVIRTFFFIVFVILFATGISYAKEPSFERHITTQHFEFFSHGINPEIQQIFDKAENIRGKFIRQLGSDFSGKTKVYITASENEFQRLQPNRTKVPSWAIGIAWPKQNLIVLKFTSKNGQTPNLLKTFKHELSHIAFGRITNLRDLPKWFVEGIAMFQASEWSLARHEQMMYAALGNSLYSLHDLARNFPSGHAGVSLAYTQSLQFVDWLYSDLGEKNFAAFIQDLASGKDFYESIAKRSGMDFDDLEAKWLASLKLKYSWIPLITGSGFLWFMVTLLFLFVVFKFYKYKAERMRKLSEEDEWMYGKEHPKPELELIESTNLTRYESNTDEETTDEQTEDHDTKNDEHDIFIIKLAGESRYIIVPKQDEERKKIIERLLNADDRFFHD